MGWWGTSFLMALRATFGDLGRKICCVCWINWWGTGRHCTLVLPPWDQEELDFYSRQDAAGRETAPLVQQESLGCGKGKPSRDRVGEAEPTHGRPGPPSPAFQPTLIVCLSAAAPGIVETLVVL